MANYFISARLSYPVTILSAYTSTNEEKLTVYLKDSINATK
jgi:hypothetical protein